MLEQLFNRNLQHHTSAPLLKERVDYLCHLSDKKATEFRLKLIEGYLLRAIEYLHLEDRRIVTEEEIDAAALKWAEKKTTHHLKKSFSPSGQRLFSMYSKSWLRYLNRLQIPPVNQKEELLEELYKTSQALHRHLKAPLLQERISYLEYLKSSGKGINQLKCNASYLLHITEILNLQNSRIITNEELYDAAYKWGHNKKGSFSKYGKNAFKRIGADWLNFMGRLSTSQQENDPLLRKLFKSNHSLLRQITTPLLSERLTFLNYRKKQGIKDSTIRNEAYHLLIIIQHLEFYALRSVKISEITQMVEKWEKLKKRQASTEACTHKNKLSLIHTAKRWMSLLNCLENDVMNTIPFSTELNDYLSYQSIVKGLSEETILSRRRILSIYFKLIKEQCAEIGQITSDVIEKSIIRRRQKNLSRRTIRTELSILKSFFLFTAEKKWSIKGLSQSIRIPRIYEDELLPSGPQRADIEKLITQFAVHKPVNIRDFAILQLLTVYGLRSSEIANLQIDDLDWRKELIYIRRSKRSRPQSFPLTSTVGNAIIHYLKEVRPTESDLKQVFLTYTAPHNPLNNSSIYTIVNKVLKPMNLKTKSHGPHSLRHAGATHLINSGFSLKEISDYLGHQNLETTRIYAKVDLTNLHKVADLNWEKIL